MLELFSLQATAVDRCGIYSGIPEAETFGRNRNFSAFGFRFRPLKVKAEYGRNSKKALDFFFPSVFQNEVLMAWFSLSVF